MMKTVALYLLLCWMTPALTQHIPCLEEAAYRVEAKCKWTADTHPTYYPDGFFPHFSKMCGTTHTAAYQMWSINQTATPGVKSIAETGNCSTFMDEVSKCEASENCHDDGEFDWNCVPDGTLDPECTFEGTIIVSNASRHVSMLSMVAPSPDWVFGLDSVDLCQKDEQNGAAYWTEKYPVDKESFSLYAIDAGTDNGTIYTSADAPLPNPEPIKFFNGNDSSNIFYHPTKHVVLPICEIKMKLLKP